MTNYIARLIAAVAHDVVTEYRRLNDDDSTQNDRQEISCTQIITELAWQPTAEAPATPFGFGLTRDTRS